MPEWISSSLYGARIFEPYIRSIEAYIWSKNVEIHNLQCKYLYDRQICIKAYIEQVKKAYEIDKYYQDLLLDKLKGRLDKTLQKYVDGMFRSAEGKQIQKLEGQLRKMLNEVHEAEMAKQPQLKRHYTT